MSEPTRRAAISQLWGGKARCVCELMKKIDANRPPMPCRAIWPRSRKVTDDTAIAAYGVASTPQLVIDDKVVHAGGLPRPEDVVKWLAA